MTDEEICIGCLNVIEGWKDGEPLDWKNWFDTTKSGEVFHWKCRDRLYEPEW
jgi:hypothetical protein